MCNSKLILYYCGVPLYIGVSIFDYLTKCIKYNNTSIRYVVVFVCYI